MDLLNAAKSLAERVEMEAIKANIPVAVCIVDVHGNLVLQHRMNGAPAFALEISERKAYTAGLVRMRTAEIFPLVQPGQPLFGLTSLGGGRFCAIGGGAPLLDEAGQVFAGVGVSGGSADEDIGIMEAALRHAA